MLFCQSLLPQTAPLSAMLVYKPASYLSSFYIISSPSHCQIPYLSLIQSIVCYFKTFAISFSLPHYSNPLLSCSPAASSSVQFLQGFVAIIIIFSQCALCTLEGCFDRSSLVICLKADFSFSLQHCAYVPPLLQLPGIQHVLPGQFVCSFWLFLSRRADGMEGVQGCGL